MEENKKEQFKKFQDDFRYLWYSGKVYEEFDKIKENRKDKIVELCSKGVTGTIEDERFWTKSSSVLLDFRYNGTCQFINREGEKGLGYYTESGNQITVQFILYESLNLDKEGDEPKVHSVQFERNPENKNYLIFENTKLYTFERLLRGLSSSTLNYKSPFTQHMMELVSEAKSNTNYEIMKKYDFYQYVKNGVQISLNFYYNGNVSGSLYNVNGKNGGNIFGIYSVNGSEINIKYFYHDFYDKNEKDIKESFTMKLINLNSTGKDGLALANAIFREPNPNSNDIDLDQNPVALEEALVKMEANLSDPKSLINAPVISVQEGTILHPYETLYLPLWHNYNSPRASDYSDINLTNLLSKAIKTNLDKVFISEDIKSEGELFTRTTHTFNFYPNGTFLHKSFTGNATNRKEYATFGLYSIKEGLVYTEFYDLSERKTIKEQALTMISDSQIKFEEYFMNESDGKVNFSEKILAVFDKSILEKLNIECSTILNLLSEKAEVTNFEGSYSYVSWDDWDTYQKNIDFYLNGTCKLRVYRAGHDYSGESYNFGNYSTNGNQFTLKICSVGGMIPSLLKLTVGETVEWEGTTLTKK